MVKQQHINSHAPSPKTFQCFTSCVPFPVGPNVHQMGAEDQICKLMMPVLCVISSFSNQTSCLATALFFLSLSISQCCYMIQMLTYIDHCKVTPVAYQ